MCHPERSRRISLFALRVILSKAKDPFIRRMRHFTALRSVQYDNFAERVILSEAKNLFIRRMRYFTALRSVQYDNFALCVILSVAEGSLYSQNEILHCTAFRSVWQLRGNCHFEQSEKSQKKRRHYFFPHCWRFSLLAVVRTTRTTAILFQKMFFALNKSKF